MDTLDELILGLAYLQIDRSPSKVVTGRDVWEKVNASNLDLAPVVVPGRLSRLVSLGFLQKDAANSSARIKVYRPTDAGYQKWRELDAEWPHSAPSQNP
jgi:hypothetical protein